MGGKTQQRVAGNVKPSSSGRIRELLVNKHGGGGIITFSTLSNSNAGQAKQADQPKQSHPAPENPKAQETIQTDNPPNRQPVRSSAHNQPTPSATQAAPAGDKPTLVVRRVGNRDFFTRVKFAPDTADKTIRPVNHHAGVFKPDFREPDELRIEPLVINKVGSTDESADGSSQTDDQPQVDEAKEQVEESLDLDTLLDRLDEAKGQHAQIALNNLEDTSDEMLDRQRNLIKLLRMMIKDFRSEISLLEWDLVVSSIYKWIGCILESKSLSDSSSKATFCVDVFNFIHQLIVLARNLDKGVEGTEDDFPLKQSLLDDWRNLQSSSVYMDLLRLFFKLAPVESPEKQDVDIMEALANIVVSVEPGTVMTNENLIGHLDTEVKFDPEFQQPKNIKYCDFDGSQLKGALSMCNLLKSNHRIVVLCAHAMLRKTMDQICASFENTPIFSDNDDLDRLLPVPPAAFMSVLTLRDSIMSALLSDYRVGDISVTIEPNLDSYACTLAYLFTWDLVTQFIVGVDKEAGHRIVHSLKKLGLIHRLLDTVFMLLPPLGERDSLNLRFSHGESRQSDDQPWSLDEFLKSPLMTSVRRPVNEIELVALHVYFSVALHFPVTVRKWFNNNSNKRLCNLVNEYTVKHISQVICSLEMESVQEKCHERANEDKLKNLVIKARPTAKEVYAIYTRDEFRMELTIKLPINYPLGPVQIDGGKRIGVTDVKWRSWLLQLTTFLSHQNGPILDGIDLWRRNIDKKFEGIEKCMICFSILHSNYQLPKKKCQTCLKMFHNLCLYKWFETSGNSTCPLCRNTW